MLAAKAVAVIDFADRLERCEEALMLLLNAGRPGAAQQAVSVATAEPAIDKNNAETMAPAPDQAAGPVAARAAETPAIDNNNEITMEAAAALDEAVRATLPRRRETSKRA